jgi:hypothetical protein
LPLSEKARIEVYLPDLPTPAYQDLLETFDRELTYAFGGCTIQRGLDGSYLSLRGDIIRDRINLLYTDAPFAFDEDYDTLVTYAQEIRAAAFDALNEEAILITVTRVYHSE